MLKMNRGQANRMFCSGNPESGDFWEIKEDLQKARVVMPWVSAYTCIHSKFGAHRSASWRCFCLLFRGRLKANVVRLGMGNIRLVVITGDSCSRICVMAGFSCFIMSDSGDRDM